MPTRANVPSWWWGSNHPMEGMDAIEQYRKVRWGNEPHQATVVTVPTMKRRQHLVELGKLRVVFVRLRDGREAAFKMRRPYPPLAFGELDNRLYIVPTKTLRAMAARREFGRPGASYTVLQTDYDANKGGEDVYWWHEHEAPFPRLVILPSGLPVYRGGRYRVAPEGIVG